MPMSLAKALTWILLWGMLGGLLLTVLYQAPLIVYVIAVPSIVLLYAMFQVWRES